MRAHERRRWERIDSMLAICKERGIRSELLAQLVMDTCHSPGFGRAVNSQGLAAQIAYLSEALGRRLEGRLRKMGGVLDAIVAHTSDESTDIDWVDASGDVIFDEDENEVHGS